MIELWEYTQTKRLLTNLSFFCKQEGQMGLRDISVLGYSSAALALLCAGRDILKGKCSILKFKVVR